MNSSTLQYTKLQCTRYFKPAIRVVQCYSHTTQGITNDHKNN